MTRRDCDIAIVGGGLAGGLVALALAQRRPEVEVRVLESGSAAGGNHRWSWFDSDLPPGGRELLAPLPMSRWEQGYDVAFPGFVRTLPTPYRSLDSRDFSVGLDRQLPTGALHTGIAVQQLERDAVMLVGGQRLSARAVIDCRGFAPAPQLKGGWQVFLGRHLRTASPHGIERPVIMDAMVDQLGGYRFVYLLPLTERELFIEDTYYQDSPLLDRSALSARLDDYAHARGWVGEILGSETGVLPVITGGDFAGFQRAQRIPGVGLAGARGGFVHPLTSYTLPFAVETALMIAEQASLSGEQLASMLERRARDHWRRTRFYRCLGAMLYGAKPEERRRVFERFYRLDQGLIERFYAARSTFGDRARILCGRPPVPVGRAVRALSRGQPPLQIAA